jgi:hypothetical protein
MRTCIVCGCTDELACEEGCHWAQLIGKTKGICSSCPTPARNEQLTKEQKARRKLLASRIANLDGTRRLQLTYFKKAQESYERAVEERRDFERAAGAR